MDTKTMGENTMSKSETTQPSSGPTDGPAPNPSVPPMAAVEFLEARYNAKIEMLEDVAKSLAESGRYADATRKSSEADGIQWALFAARKILNQHAQQEAGTPTS
jgi:hypothetical protein